MYRVLLVDDEILVRTGLKMIIDWEQAGFIIIGESDNGRDALEYLSKTTVDLVLVDIKMPEMDGLTLIRRIMDSPHSPEIIILSNYKDFNYAQEAIRCGVLDYLLKSNINAEDILPVLKRTKEFLDKKHRVSAQNDFEKINAKSVSQDKILSVFNRVLQGKSTPHKMPFEFPVYMAVLILHPATGERRLSFDEIMERIKNLIGGYFQKCRCCLSTEDLRSDRIWLLLWGYSFSENVLEALFHRLLSSIELYLNESVSAGISSSAETPDRIGELPGEALRAVRQKLFEDGSLFSYPLIRNYPVDITLQRSLMDIFNYKMLPASYDKEEWETQLKRFFDQLKEYGDIVLVQRCCQKLAGRLNSEKADLYSQTGNSGPLNQITVERLLDAGSMDDVLNILLDHTSKMKCNTAGDPVSHAIRFIENHLAEDLSLPLVAGQVGLSPSYFSTSFSKKVGRTFSEYVTERRVDKAARLLKERPDLRIYEVAMYVGIKNERYFNDVFRDHKGITPGSWRKSMIPEETLK